MCTYAECQRNSVALANAVDSNVMNALFGNDRYLYWLSHSLAWIIYAHFLAFPALVVRALAIAPSAIAASIAYVWSESPF